MSQKKSSCKKAIKGIHVLEKKASKATNGAKGFGQENRGTRQGFTT